MAKEFTPKVLTANDLLEGDVIYRATDGTWTRWHAKAELFTDPARAQSALDAAQAEVDHCVGAYLADARPGPNGPEPIHFREDFRARGPSNYPHGKQAETSHV
jgi:hypothetical protein